jgi:hypothetical protein
VKDSALESKTVEHEFLDHLFSVAGQSSPSEALQEPDAVRLDRRQFCTLLVHIACYRRNPPQPKTGQQQQHRKKEAGPPENAVPVLECVQSFLVDVLPRMETGNTQELRETLGSDEETQNVLDRFRPQLQTWTTSLLASMCTRSLLRRSSLLGALALLRSM